jgi:malate dehydrogenase (oxaloacetate-decarboxylating)
MLFTPEERKALGLTGLVPAEITTLEAQVKRALIQYERLPDALSKNICLLHDRNEVLFHRLFSALVRNDSHRQRSDRRYCYGALPP